ncbi:hypothetical protein BDV93DRAFT_525410 [Ceratobasidium sp. AG-I]|nr:hypothetical protein BDV93DRAFT_525410 [Ceratobasidium sp. AG-I]
MQKSQLAPQYVAPLSLYIDEPSQFSEPPPTLDAVKSAISAFCPFDRDTGKITAQDSTTSLDVLAKILHLPYYPRHLGLLDNPLFIPVCFYLLEDYLQHHKIFDRVFGFLMIKVLTLATMVGILVQKKQLVPFINSLGKSHTTTQGQTNSTPKLVYRVTDIIQEEMQQNNGFTKGLLLWTVAHSVEVRGQEGFYTPARCENLLIRLWEQRDVMLTTLKRSPTPGLSAMLHLVRSNAFEDPAMSVNKTLEVLSQSQDLIVRYSLVDTPEEGNASQKYWSSKQYDHLTPVDSKDHLTPVDSKDHQTITRLLVRRLESPENGIEPLSPHHAKYLLHQFFDSIQKRKTYELCVPVIKATFDYLWGDIARSETEGRLWKDVAGFGFAFLGMIKDRLLEDQRLPSAKSIAPAVFEILYEAEFVKVCARLMLMPLPQWVNPSLGAVYKSQINFEEEEIARDGFKIVGDLVDALKYYSSLTRPLVEQSYRDWVKVLDVKGQIFARSEPNSRAGLYTEICIMELRVRQARIRCKYDRCPGSDNVRCIEQLVCGECPKHPYCSARCQKADWPQHKASHT